MPRLGLLRLAVPALVLAAGLGALAPAAPASAAVTGTTQSGDVVLYEHCQQHPITYDLAVGPFTSGWRVEIQVVDPEGLTSQGTVLNSADKPPLSGTTYFQFCGSETPGTWTVRSMIRYAPIDLTPDSVLTTSTFQVRPMQTQTTLRAKRLRDGRFRLVSRVQQEAPQGFERAAGITVRLERQTGDAWKKVRGLTLTTVRGRAVAVLGRGTYRAVVPGGGNHTGSVSEPVRAHR
ncbi:hypothetical protein G5V58_05325 [Nocardioides anomalus]|uniref:Uncharacterized protein n=1 Tax=Nocardioides anomalus TaxID=2712223 RepID=A0A6G6WA87_9ACTN|nr:hypothetical protein [Nocardioides anomalus]QIG42261.1 hypothetical protein G5V58_05325 [Nocardioides anomalus]